MEELNAKEILQAMEETRQEFGTLNMILDGAQVHFMVETLLEGLKTAAATFATFNPETLNRVEDMFRLA